MELRANLRRQAKQTITITPQIIQSIKLLQYGQEELQAYLREQEERNPLIEIVGRSEGASGKSAPGLDKSESAPEGAPRHETRFEGGRSVAQGAASGSSSTAGGSGRDLRSIEEIFASSISLREHLRSQVAVNIRSRVDQLIAVEIVESVENDGYLRRDLDEIAEFLGATDEKVETVLKQVQRFEPTGVAARNLSECLRLQIEERDEMTLAMAAMLDNLTLLADYNVEGLAKICGVDCQEIVDMVRKIQELDPRPGRRYDSDPVMPALPDVKVDMRQDGTFHIELNSELLPKVLVNREYYAEMRAGATGKDDTRFVTDCMKNATWLTRNLDQRANTILKVSTEIVKRQEAFFKNGVEHIKPLCLSDVADTLGIHSSTVCRATADKYMMTNRGMFELKYFFTNAINSWDGEQEFSGESIRGKIRKLVDSETVDTVFSDDAIMVALRKDGVDIARRTVAKYRELMRIPSSISRKRRHKAELITEHA